MRMISLELNSVLWTQDKVLKNLGFLIFLIFSKELKNQVSRKSSKTKICVT